MPIDFGLPERRFVPEIDEVPINPFRMKLLIEELETYNLACRQWKKYYEGEEIPEKYRGRNRYWASPADGNDAEHGPYTIIWIYDLDPSALDGRALIAKYKIARYDGAPLQTLQQAEKHVRAAQLDAERKERQAKKDPRLNNELKVHMPLMYSPTAARRKIDASQKTEVRDVGES